MWLECTAKKFFHRLGILWSCTLSDHNRVTASNQFALPVRSWPVTELKKLDQEACKIILENGGKHPNGSSAILDTPREKGGRGLRSIEEYKVTKAAVKLYKNGDQVMTMVREFNLKRERNC